MIFLLHCPPITNADTMYDYVKYFELLDPDSPYHAWYSGIPLVRMPINYIYIQGDKVLHKKSERGTIMVDMKHQTCDILPYSIIPWNYAKRLGLSGDRFLPLFDDKNKNKYQRSTNKNRIRAKDEEYSSCRNFILDAPARVETTPRELILTQSLATIRNNGGNPIEFGIDVIFKMYLEEKALYHRK